MEDFNFDMESFNEEDYNSNFRNYPLKLLLKILDEECKVFHGELYDIYRDVKINDNDKKHSRIDISDWGSYARDILCRDILKGVYYAFIVYSNRSFFPIGVYNSVLSALAGEKYVFAYTNGIKWFDEEIKALIKEQDVKFPNLVIRRIRNNNNEFPADEVERYGGWEDDAMMDYIDNQI